MICCTGEQSGNRLAKEHAELFESTDPDINAGMRTSTTAEAGFSANLSHSLFLSSASGAVSITVSWLGREKCQ